MSLQHRALTTNADGDLVDLGSWETREEADLAIAVHARFTLAHSATTRSVRSQKAAEYFRCKLYRQYQAETAAK